jgi:RNA polymerase sigma-70 factor (ECF subfamily)
MRKSTDQAILERARRFESQALEEIFDCFSPGIYRYAYHLLGDTELARECMSETFSRFLTALTRDAGPDEYLQAYLYRIAHNWISDYYRRKTPPTLPIESVTLSDSKAEPHRIVADQMSAKQIRDALAFLTPDQRQVIILKYLEGWKNDAIALAMNKPVGAIKALQHRALEALHRILSTDEDFTV